MDNKDDFNELNPNTGADFSSENEPIEGLYNEDITEEIANENDINNYQEEDRQELNKKEKRVLHRKRVNDEIDEAGANVIEKFGVPKPIAKWAAKTNGGPLSPTNSPATKLTSRNLRNKVADATEDMSEDENGETQDKTNEQQASSNTTPTLPKTPLNNKDNKEDDAKKQVKAELTKKVLTSPYFWIAAGIIALILLIIILLMMFLSEDSENNGETYGYYDSTCNFNETKVIYNTCDNNSLTLDLKDYIIGLTYNYTQNNSYSNEAIKALMIILKTNSLAIGNYNNSNKQINQSCDNTYQYIDVSSIDNLEYQKLENLYNSIEENLYVDSSMTGTIETMNTDSYLELNDAVLNNLFNSTGTYTDILNTNYPNGNYYLYTLADNCSYLTLTSNESYWWPIGSQNETSPNIYGGTPTTVAISSDYGDGDGRTSPHKGIDIHSLTSDKDHVIIAAQAGTVIDVYNSCDDNGYYGNKCGGGRGNYVIIEHENGVQTLYYHMRHNSIVVQEGQTVAQGQKIGIMGNSGSSTGYHLHFGVKVNNTDVNPHDYVNAEEPRYVSSSQITLNEGNSNKQTVCKTLKSAYSINATIGLMINIQSESAGTYDPQITGDNGTSYGLCQWHNSRWEELKNYRKNDYNTIEGQLAFLKYELENKYQEVNKYVTGMTYNASTIAENFCLNFERPANKEVTCRNRVTNHLESISNYVRNDCN